MLHVRVRTFAQVREALGCEEENLILPDPSSVADVWASLVDRVPRLQNLTHSTRAARNGAMAAFADELGDGDELAFLPPFGGG